MKLRNVFNLGKFQLGEFIPNNELLTQQEKRSISNHIKNLSGQIESNLRKTAGKKNFKSTLKETSHRREMQNLIWKAEEERKELKEKRRLLLLMLINGISRISRKKTS